MSGSNVTNEPQQAEPLRVENQNVADAWLRGYSDGYHQRAEDLPPVHGLHYLRGYIAGMKALKS